MHRVATEGTVIKSTQAHYRLMSWLSPSFPVGAYSYSHGIEYAFEAGEVTDQVTLQSWIKGVLGFGAGKMDAVLFRAGWEAIASEDEDLLEWAIVKAATLRPSKEMALEASAQGTAFLETLRKSWPREDLDRLDHLHELIGRPASYPVVVAVSASVAGINLEDALAAYLHAFISNLVSAGVRMIPLGQTAGQQIISSLEQPVGELAHTVSTGNFEALKTNLGTAAVVVDWTSMKHETQYTRIFRS